MATTKDLPSKDFAITMANQMLEVFCILDCTASAWTYIRLIEASVENEFHQLINQEDELFITCKFPEQETLTYIGKIRDKQFESPDPIEFLKWFIDNLEP